MAGNKWVVGGGFWLVFIYWSLIIIPAVKGYMIGRDPNRRAEFLDPEGKYHLEWKVDLDKSRITFNVTVKTQGWVLFGLANNADAETGKDVVVGGVLGRNGATYFSDRHEERNGGTLAILDNSQDYKLEDGWETRTETFLSFSRSLDTCDTEDYPISDNKVSVIWAYGDIDDYDVSRGQAYRRRGSYELYLLEADYSPRIIRDAAGNPRLIGGTIIPEENRDNTQLWTISTSAKITSAHTTYLCSIHKAPRLQRKHHVIGYDVHLSTPQSLEHVHHFSVYKCNAPRASGSSARNLFQKFVNGPAETCFILGRPPRNPNGMPVHLCNELHSGWALGGRSFFYPPEAGSPIGEEPDEYYMIQMHYDNPQMKSGIEVSARLDIWYTSRLRSNDAGFMTVGIATLPLPPSILVPPKTSNHRVLGHCSGECTKRMYPPEGVSVFAVLKHGHNSAVGMRLRHFDMKKKIELPWMSYDDNYSNRFQQIRHVKEPVRLLPGDQMTMECTNDNTWTNGSVVGGYSTSQEMCIGFIYYYGRIQDYSQCRSEIVSEEGRRRYFGGVRNITFDEGRVDWVATSPRSLAGLTVTELADGERWDEEERQELQRYHEVTQSVGTCSRDLFTRNRESLRQALESRSQLPIVYPPMEVETQDDFSGIVGYPFKAKPYIPAVRQTCLSKRRGY